MRQQLWLHGDPVIIITIIITSWCSDDMPAALRLPSLTRSTIARSPRLVVAPHEAVELFQHTALALGLCRAARTRSRTPRGTTAVTVAVLIAVVTCVCARTRAHKVVSASAMGVAQGRKRRKAKALAKALPVPYILAPPVPHGLAHDGSAHRHHTRSLGLRLPLALACARFVHLFLVRVGSLFGACLPDWRGCRRILGSICFACARHTRARQSEREKKCEIAKE